MTHDRIIHARSGSFISRNDSGDDCPCVCPICESDLLDSETCPECGDLQRALEQLRADRLELRRDQKGEI